MNFLLRCLVKWSRVWWQYQGCGDSALLQQQETALAYLPDKAHALGYKSLFPCKWPFQDKIQQYLDKKIYRDLLKLMCSCPPLYGQIIFYVISKFTGICWNDVCSCSCPALYDYDLLPVSQEFAYSCQTVIHHSIWLDPFLALFPPPVSQCLSYWKWIQNQVRATQQQGQCKTRTGNETESIGTVVQWKLCRLWTDNTLLVKTTSFRAWGQSTTPLLHTRYKHSTQLQ